MKKLSEMTLEELWRLFPIILVGHRDCWTDYFADEQAFLTPLLPSDAEIYHIGSTAVKGIMAKPIIDILAELPNERDLSEAAKIVAEHGYFIMSVSDRRVSLNKGYTERGFAERVFHLHIRHKSEKDEVLFRDYLNSHAEVAKEYERLKSELWKKYEFDRDAYTNAKSEFVKKYTDIAKAEFKKL